MDDERLVEPPDERETVDDPQMRDLDDPNSATNESNVGTLAGVTGPTPLTGGQIVSAATDDTDDLT